MTKHSAQEPRRKGYVLFEVLLAVGIFSVSVVGFAVALNMLFEVSVDTARQRRVQDQLSSYLAESRVLDLEPGSEILDSADGITYERTVTELDLTNEDGQVLRNLYQISIQATWEARGQEDSSIAEIYVYQP